MLYIIITYCIIYNKTTIHFLTLRNHMHRFSTLLKIPRQITQSRIEL